MNNVVSDQDIIKDNILQPQYIQKLVTSKTISSTDM